MPLVNFFIEKKVKSTILNKNGGTVEKNALSFVLFTLTWQLKANK